MGDGEEEIELALGNVPFGTPPETLHHLLADVGVKYARLTCLKRGYAFLTFLGREAADDALTAFHAIGVQLGGRDLTLQRRGATARNRLNTLCMQRGWQSPRYHITLGREVTVHVFVLVNNGNATRRFEGVANGVRNAKDAAACAALAALLPGSGSQFLWAAKFALGLETSI